MADSIEYKIISAKPINTKDEPFIRNIRRDLLVDPYHKKHLILDIMRDYLWKENQVITLHNDQHRKRIHDLSIKKNLYKYHYNNLYDDYRMLWSIMYEICEENRDIYEQYNHILHIPEFGAQEPEEVLEHRIVRRRLRYD